MACETASKRRLAMAPVILTFALAAVLAFAARAEATETIYWNNFGDEPDFLSFAGIDGSGGGQLSTGSEVIEGPEGMAYDSVSNRLFVASQTLGKGKIVAINLDGSGASTFTAPGAPVEEPEGIVVDPTTRTIYWETTIGEPKIIWAKLDGSAGGVLNTSGATLVGPCCRITIDPSGGRIYWVNNPQGGGDSISFANLDNTGGGGTLNLDGSTVNPGGEGLAVDSAAGRVYFLGNDGAEEAIGYANVNGSGGGDVLLGSAVVTGNWGLALDPSNGRLYWGNEGVGEERADAIGFVGTNGLGGGGITIATAPLSGPQDPLIIKSPMGTGAPAMDRARDLRSSLSCSTGSWAADYPGGFVYQAPRTFAYQWTRNGVAVAGAIASTFTAKSPGSYVCTVTATNQAGTASQSSAAVKVKAAKLKLTTKKKAHAKPGQTVKFKVKAANQGDLKSKTAKVCVKLPRSAKGALKASKCKSLGKLKSRGSKSATLKIKVLSSAAGTYKVTFQVKGSAGKAAKSKIILG
jgi:hypothetical protein